MSLFSDAEREIGTAMRGVRNRLANMARRAVIKIVNDNPKLQELGLAVMADEVQDDVEHFEHYGFTSSPPEGSEAILIRLGGSGDVQAVIATAYREGRPKLTTQGDVTLWTRHGQRIELKRTSIVVVLDSGADLELGEGATLGVARTTDAIALDAAFMTWAAQIEDVVNGVAPGAVTPLLAVAGANGTITGGSGTVKAVD